MASFRCHPVTSFVEHSYVITVAYLEFEHWQCFIMLYLHKNFDNTMISCRNLYIYSQKMKLIHTSTYIHIERISSKYIQKYIHVIYKAPRITHAVSVLGTHLCLFHIFNTGLNLLGDYGCYGTYATR